MSTCQSPPITSLLRSASAQSLDFGDNSPVEENSKERERTKNVEMERDTGYDGHEETRWHFVSAAEKSIWEIPVKTVLTGSC
jgi:hypothetical protein